MRVVPTVSVVIPSWNGESLLPVRLRPRRSCLIVAATLAALLSFHPSAEAADRLPPRSGIVETEPAQPQGEAPPALAPSPEAPWGGNLRVNQDATAFPQNETTIAVNPLNPLNLVGGANDYRAGDGNANCGFYASTNAGQTWSDGLISRLGFQAAGDPAVGFDRVGNVYFACLHFNRSDFANLISVSKSIDGGKTFGPPVAVTGGASIVDFNDKEYLAVDATGGPFDGVVYVSWTHFTANSADIRIARSTNGGISWSAPTSVSDTPLNQCSVPAIGPNGEVYVAWQDFFTDRIVIDKSTDGGMTFGPDRTVAGIVPIADPLGGFGWGFRTNSCPTIAVDTSAGPRRGTVYVAWADQRTGDADILIARSTDGGLTWSVPTRVNDDPAGNGRHQFFQWLSVDPHGTVHVIWYDNRDGGGALLRVFSARSTDGLTFSPNERVSDAPFDPNIQFSGGFIGDYNGLASSPAFVHALWTDSRTGNQDVFTARRPATDRPAVALGINRSDFHPGDPLVTGFVVVNPGGSETVDFFFGVRGPDGHTLAFFKPGGGVALGDLNNPATFTPTFSGLILSSGLEFIGPEIFSAVLDGGLPSGFYVLFLILAEPHNPNNIIARDAKVFRLTP